MEKVSTFSQLFPMVDAEFKKRVPLCKEKF